MNFWIARASLLVTPSPLPEQSAFAFPCSVSLYLDGFESVCMISTASETSTVPSQFASPQRVTSVFGSVVVTVSVTVVVVSVVVVSAVVVSVSVVVVSVVVVTVVVSVVVVVVSVVVVVVSVVVAVASVVDEVSTGAGFLPPVILSYSAFNC